MTHVDAPAKRFTAGEAAAVVAGKKGARRSPWGRGPMAGSKRAKKSWDALRATPKGKLQ